MGEKKKVPPKKKRREYKQKLKVNGSFLDIVKASVKHANKHSVPKKP